MAGWWTVCVIWGLVVSGPMLFAFKDGFMVGMMFFIVGWGPTALLVWYVVNRAGNRQKFHAHMLAVSGVAGGTGMDHAEDGTGIAINRPAKTLTLLVNGFQKSYSFAEVREWETSNERPGQIVGSGIGVGASAAVLGASIRAEREAKKNSGLFVTVKDIENPKWRIAMKDVIIQARWMEILRQEINER